MPSLALLREMISTAEVFFKINRRIKVDAKHFPTIAKGLHCRKDGMPLLFSIDDVQHTLQEQNRIAEHRLTAPFFRRCNGITRCFFIGN